MSNDPQLFVVVCTNLHAAFGPFTDLDLALYAAKELNKASKCDHVPVMFVPAVDTVKAIGAESWSSKRPEGEDGKRGYL